MLSFSALLHNLARWIDILTRSEVRPRFLHSHEAGHFAPTSAYLQVTLETKSAAEIMVSELDLYCAVIVLVVRLLFNRKWLPLQQCQNYSVLPPARIPWEAGDINPGKHIWNISSLLVEGQQSRKLRKLKSGKNSKDLLGVLYSLWFKLCIGSLCIDASAQVHHLPYTGASIMMRLITDLCVLCGSLPCTHCLERIHFRTDPADYCWLLY